MPYHITIDILEEEKRAKQNQENAKSKTLNRTKVYGAMYTDIAKKKKRKK